MSQVQQVPNSARFDFALDPNCQLVVTGFGVVRAEPTHATLRFDIEAVEDLVEESIAKVEKRAREIEHILQGAGITTNDIQRSPVVPSPQPPDFDEFAQPDIAKASLECRITERDVLDACVRQTSAIVRSVYPWIAFSSSDRPGWQSVALTLSYGLDYDQVREDAVRSAVLDARRKAEKIAETLGMVLGPASRLTPKELSPDHSRSPEMAERWDVLSPSVALRAHPTEGEGLFAPIESCAEVEIRFRLNESGSPAAPSDLAHEGVVDYTQSPLPDPERDHVQAIVLKAVGPVARMTERSEYEDRTVSAAGSGSAAARADSCEVVFHFVAEGALESVRKSITRQDARMESILKRAGVRKSQLKRTTLDYRGDGQSTEAWSSLHVNVEPRKAADLVAKVRRLHPEPEARLGEGWSLQVSSHISADNPARPEALRAAVADARERAERIAEGFGLHAGPMLELNCPGAMPNPSGWHLATLDSSTAVERFDGMTLADLEHIDVSANSTIKLRLEEPPN